MLIHMKRIILLLFSCLLCANLCVNNIKAVASIDVTINNNITGKLGQTILDQFMEVDLYPDSECSFNVSEDDDITSWFTNIPNNLSAIVDSLEDNYMIVRFTGDIDLNESVGNRLIELTIPSGYILFNDDTYDDDIVVDNNTYNYIIEDKGTFILDYKDSYIIDGYVNEYLNKDIVICFKDNSLSESFTPNIMEMVLSDHNGLKVSVKSLANNELTINYSGYPTYEDHSLIHTLISKDYLLLSNEDYVIKDRTDVCFNIITREIKQEPKQEYVIPTTGVN